MYSYGNKSVSALNAFTKGWSDRPTKNLLYVNGEFDPWRTSGVSSQFRPAVPGGAGKGGNSGKNETIASSATPVLIIPDGGHCSDLSLRNAAANPGVRSIVAQEVAILSGWVRGFYALRRRGVE